MYVDFLEDEFLSFGEIKKDLELHQLHQDPQQSLDEGEDLNSHQVFKDVTKDGTPPSSNRNEGALSAQGNEVRRQSLIHRENQPKNELCSQSPGPNMR